MPLDRSNPLWWFAVMAGGVLAAIAFAVVWRMVKLWVQAFMSNAFVSIPELCGMGLRRVDMQVVVLSKIRAAQAGLFLSVADLESLYLAGGRVPQVVTAFIVAHQAKVPLPWDTAVALDLAGHDILGLVQSAVKPSSCAGNVSLAPTPNDWLAQAMKPAEPEQSSNEETGSR